MIQVLAETVLTSTPTPMPPWNSPNGPNYPFFFITYLVLIVLGLFLSGIIIAYSPRQSASRLQFFQGATWRFSQWLLFCLLLLSAVLHTVLSINGPDATTLSFLVCAMIVLLVPLVTKIAFPGGGELDFLEDATKQQLLDLSAQVASAEIAIATAAEALAERMRRLALDSTLKDSSFSARALVEATEIVAPLLTPRSATPDGFLPNPARAGADPQTQEILRISAWVAGSASTADGSSVRMYFVLGWPQTNVQCLASTYVDADRDTPLYICVKTAATLNFGNIPSSVRPNAGQTDGPYGGVIFVPLVKGGSPGGALIVERTKSECFQPSSKILTRALADMYAFGLLR